MSSRNALLLKAHIIASVRSQEQADALQAAGVDVIRLDLSNETSVIETILRHNSKFLLL
jgi:uncharacterized protein YbjT (DUF2867 family)